MMKRNQDNPIDQLIATFNGLAGDIETIAVVPSQEKLERMRLFCGEISDLLDLLRPHSNKIPWKEVQ